ncbi:MAG: hypothetical protein HEQ19_11005 [Gloeotrichia echinulata CP02]
MKLVTEACDAIACKIISVFPVVISRKTVDWSWEILYNGGLIKPNLGKRCDRLAQNRYHSPHPPSEEGVGGWGSCT